MILNADMLDTLTKEIYFKVWKDELSVEIQDFKTELIPSSSIFRSYITMTHPLLPRKIIYSCIDMSEEILVKTENDYPKLIHIIDKKQMIAIEETRKHIKKEVDKLLESKHNYLDHEAHLKVHKEVRESLSK